jgi:hypothetical protein
MIKRLLLDLDGPCNCMIMHALEFVGCPVSRYDNTGYPLRGDYDMVKAANLMLGSELTRRQFWSLIPRKLWAETPPSQEFPWLLRTAEKLVGREVYFATQPRAEEPDSAAGKLEWIHRYAPQFASRYVLSPNKFLLANAFTLLIDDSDDQVNSFREAGGNAILMPRPWNSLHAIDTLGYLQEQFAVYTPPPVEKPTALQTKFSHLHLIPSPEILA